MTEGGEPEPDTRPEFLEVFEDLRARPNRKLHRRLRRMESRVSRRRPAGKGDLQRGDLAEPPPVLDLVLDHSADHAEVRRMLVESCAVDPVWALPLEPDTASAEDEGADEGSPEESSEETATKSVPGPAEPLRRGRGRLLRMWSRPAPVETVPHALPRARFEARESDTEVTTDELYDLIERLVGGGFAWRDDPPDPPKGRRPPPPPRLPRLRSLLWLRRCDLARIRRDTEGESFEKTSDHGHLPNSSLAQIEVINGLREARLKSAVEQRDRLLERSRQAAAHPGSVIAPHRWEITRSRALVHWRRLARVAAVTSRWVTRVSGKATFGLLDEKILTPLAFIVSLVVAATPFAFVGLAAQQLNELVSLVIGFLLAAVYLLTVFFFFVPWSPYRWLDHHRYVMDRSTDRDEQERDPDQDQNRFGRHRARGVHLLNELHHPDRNKGRLGDGATSDTPRPPATHRIAVNALLDDLHDVYGAHRPRGRARASRPVLVFEQRGLGRVGRYLVRLIEDERLRRALPDPLLLVQVRDRRAEAPLVKAEVDVTRHGHLPEFDGTDPHSEPVRRWLWERQRSGALGVERTLTLPVTRLSRASRDRTWRTEPTWVLTRPVQAGLLSGTGAAATALLVVVGLVLVPAQVQSLRPCVQRGVLEPAGITRIDDGGGGHDCVGVTFGDFVFHERLEQVTDLIREQNEKVDEAGVPYVTIAHLAELSSPRDDDPALAGAHGELLGLAHRQAEHNDHRSAEIPRIKLLIGNAGHGWAGARVTAEEIVARAGREGLGMDRPVAAVGFGHSVAPNSEAIQKVGEAFLPMVGTTATYDDVARWRDRAHNEFYFPVAPANTRIARQAAHWARYGVSWTDAQGRERGLPSHETVVALANAQTDSEGDRHEQYGPHLAEEFVTAFEERKGQVWEGAKSPDGVPPANGAHDGNGVLLYQDPGDDEDSTTLREHVARLCAAEEPPDLLYFAGRSSDFVDFYQRFSEAGQSACGGGRITLLGGDDISKSLSDEADRVRSNARKHPVYYTPLAPSGPWGDQGDVEGDTGAGDLGFYDAVDRLLEDLHEEDEEEGEDDDGERTRLSPSVAHAAMGNDALLVLSGALPPVGPGLEEFDAKNPLSRLGLLGPPFLRTEEQYEGYRDSLHAGVKDLDHLTGVSGYIAFDPDRDGNWFGDRMVQLVLAGPFLTNPETGREQVQHVIQRCGMRYQDLPEPGKECLPTASGGGTDEQG